MSKILVIGAGLNGLATALLLARDGHDVTVLERDAAEPTGSPEALWQGWNRKGVNQFHHPHFMLPRWRIEMEQELPDVLDELERRGGRRVNLVSGLPEAVTGGRRDGDDRFDTVTARRPVLEATFVAAADRQTGLEIRRGVTVTGLLTRQPNSAGTEYARVAGVMTAGGEAIHADLVIDASGRRSAVSTMLTYAGGRPPSEEREDSGFVYYTRHYRGAGGEMPEAEAPLLQHFESLSILTLPCDADTWAVGFVASAHDRELRKLRHLPTWERALREYPTAAHWGLGEPITGVQVIAGIEDRYRRLFRDDSPVATGLVAVGDAWACTNPSLGRGASIGLIHARTLRNTLRDVSTAAAMDLALRFDELTEREVAPWYRATLTFDRHRLAEIRAEIDGVPYTTPDSGWGLATALYAAARHDSDLLRAQASIAALLATPQDALSGPGMLERVIALGGNLARYPDDAPRRSDLLGAIASSNGLPEATKVRSAGRPSRSVASSPVRLHVQDTGTGEAVLMLHGWPDDHRVWRHQVPSLVASGLRVIAPDLRGFGRSDKPGGTHHYAMVKVVSDLLRLLDERGVERVHVVGHDWGGAIAAVLAAMAPSRVSSLACLSVGHPAAFATAGTAQREKSWYMLLFQFQGIAEQWLAQDDFANLRAWTRHPDIEDVVVGLQDRAALTASLGLYRAVLPPETLLAPTAPLPPIQAPTMGVWSTDDVAITEPVVSGTAAYVVGPWRYERLEGVGHWMQLEAPDSVTGLLLDFIGGVRQVTPLGLAAS